MTMMIAQINRSHRYQSERRKCIFETKIKFARVLFLMYIFLCRVNLQTRMAIIHNLFFRENNRIVTELPQIQFQVSTRIQESTSTTGTRVSLLKVHKIEIFFGFDLEICNISLSCICQNIKIYDKNFFDWASIGRGTIFPSSLKTTRNGKKF